MARNGVRLPGAPGRTVTILVDVLRDHGRDGRLAGEWCHMASDAGFDELHAFARRLGLPPFAFERDHYDLRPALRERAVRLGAEEVGRREFLLRMAGPRGDRVRARSAGRAA